MTDMVSGGAGAELYRVRMPNRMIGRPVREVAPLLLEDNGATLLAVARNGEVHTNPGAPFVLIEGDEIVLLAESMERLASLSDAGPSRT